MPSTSALLWTIEHGVSSILWVSDARLRIGPVARLDRLGMSSGVDITFPLRNLTSRGGQHITPKQEGTVDLCKTGIGYTEY